MLIVFNVLAAPTRERKLSDASRGTKALDLAAQMKRQHALGWNCTRQVSPTMRSEIHLYLGILFRSASSTEVSNQVLKRACHGRWADPISSLS